MRSVCQVQNHEYEELDFICTNPKCKNIRIACSKCVDASHNNCANFILKIQDILEKNFSSNVNWISNDQIRQAAHLLYHYKISEGKNQLLSIYEDLISREFDNLLQYINNKVLETKEMIIQNARDLYDASNINIEEFRTQMNGLYNLDELVAIVDHFENLEIGVNATNKALNSFFEDIASKRSQEKNLKEIAKYINSFAQYYVEVDKKPFEEFKTSLQFDKFKACPFKIWNWNRDLKSTSITIDNDMVQKNTISLNFHTAVVGNLALTKGLHRWNIEVNTGKSDHSWICFGVIEKDYEKKVIDFPFCYGFGIDTFGRAHNMENEGLLPNYDSKVFNCELDMDQGIFTISYQGTILAKQQKEITGKKLVPFADLGEPGNSVRLDVLTPVEE